MALAYGGTGECAKARGCLTRISHGESGVAAAGVCTVPAVSADGERRLLHRLWRTRRRCDGAHSEPDRMPRSTSTATTPRPARPPIVATVNTNDYPETSAVTVGVR